MQSEPFLMRQVASWSHTARVARCVIFNRTLLTPDQLHNFERMSGNKLPDGRYWYDKTAGLWGREGAGPFGTIQAGFELGGDSREDASQGRTGVFINGRQ